MMFPLIRFRCFITVMLVAMSGAGPAAGADTRESGTALMQAVNNNRLDEVKELLAAKVDPSPVEKDGGGRSALFNAVIRGNLEIAMLLVEAGANVNADTEYGESPLRLAVRGNTPAHAELVKAMLVRRAHVEAGQIPDYDSSSSCKPLPARIDSSNASIEAVAGLALRRTHGTPLGIAAQSGSVEIVRALLAAKANVNARQYGWRTPLMVAVAAGHADIVRLLLGAGADTSAKDSCGNTAAMLATQSGRAPIVALLNAAQ